MDTKYIIKSLLDIDFYKFLMGQIIFLLFPDVPVRFEFKNRTLKVKLGKFIKEEDLRRELDHVMTLRFNNTDLHYLRGTNEYNDRMFCEPYLEFLRSLRLPQYELEYQGEEICLTFPGKWSEVTYWETLSLSIINELYFRSQMALLSPAERKKRITEGKKRLKNKIKKLLLYPDITISEFGTRRRFSRDWQEYVISELTAKLPSSQFRGTSNVYQAMKHGILPMGTNAHELPMVFAGCMQRDDEELRNSQHEVLKCWWAEYGEGLSIILPDTFGSDFVFRTLSREQAQKWKGFRHDSGDPFEFGEKVIAFYEGMGIDPKKKMIVYSDGLDLETIIALRNRFAGRILVTFGWGTDLTNDLGFQTLSLVTKAVMACGKPLVKLSDTIQKATGPKHEVARYTRVFGYKSTYSKIPTC